MKSSACLSPSLTGAVSTGIGKGAGFTSLDWVREQFLQHCGLDPYPGTLNLLLETETDLGTWQDVKGQGGLSMTAPAGACAATLYPICIADAVTGAIVVPTVAGYPVDQVEIVAAVGLRQHLELGEGDALSIAIHTVRKPLAVVFDVDGTLLNSLDGYHIAASRATAPYGYTVTQQHVRQALNSNQPFWNFVVPPERRDDTELIAALRAETMRHWPDVLAEFVDVIPGSLETLAQLREASVRLAIYTGSDGESFAPLRAAGLLDLFEFVVTGKDVKVPKPDPEGIRLCLEQLGVAAEDVVYVGDSCIDVAASRAAGVRPVSVLTGAGDSASLSAAGAHRVLPSVAHLPGVLLPDGE